MTAQVRDFVNFRGEKYSLTTCNALGLFEPKQIGIEVVGFCSACWRGHLCGYRVDGDQLLLDELWLCTLSDLSRVYPPIFGVTPRPPEHRESIFSAVYPSLNHPVPYTGGLLIGREFDRGAHFPPGFGAVWQFVEVHELIFEAGRLVQTADHTARMNAVREELLRDPPPPPQSFEEWLRASRDAPLAQCFVQSYG